MQIGLLRDVSLGKKITTTQWRLIALWIGLIVLILGVFALVFEPRQKQLDILRLKTLALEKEAQFIDKVIPKNLPPQEARNKLKDIYRQMNKKRAPTIPSITKQLSDYARRHGMQVVSMASQSKIALVDHGGFSIKIDGSQLQSFDVKIELKSTYTNLVKYFEVINRLVPAYVVCEKMRLLNDAPGSERLRAAIELKIYTLD